MIEEIEKNQPWTSPNPSMDEQGWPHFSEHSLFEAAVGESAREHQVSREMAMMCALGAIATACQGLVDVEMPTGHRVPTSLMLLTIAESGERKTVTQNYFFEAITNLNDVAHRTNEAALLQQKVDHQLWITQKKYLERAFNKCATQGDEAATHAALEAVAEHLRAEPQPVRSGKFLYEDTTPQALVQMLYENIPHGCLLTSEASSIFSGKALGELDKLNTLWDGGSVKVDRISRDSFVLQNARLTLSLMAQPNVINRFMSKRGEEARGTGFLARFLVVKPRTMAGHRTNQKLSKLSRKKAFNTRIQELLTSESSSERQVLQFSEQAKDFWFMCNQYLEKQMQENGLYYYLKDHASKLLENTSRLAATLHTFERKNNSDIEIDIFTLKFCWYFTQNCSKHFIEHLANEPQIVTDTNLLAHFLLKTAYKRDLHSPDPETESNRKSDPNRIKARPVQPGDLIIGVETIFTLSQVKQSGPSVLRGRANSERLYSAIDLLIKLGHVKRERSHFKFRESILLSTGEPELKNGQIITIKELPLFCEQEFVQENNSPHHTSGYRIKIS